MAKDNGKAKGTVVLVGLAGLVVLGSTAVVSPGRRSLPVVPPTGPVAAVDGEAAAPGPRRTAVIPDPVEEDTVAAEGQGTSSTIEPARESEGSDATPSSLPVDVVDDDSAGEPDDEQ